MSHSSEHQHIHTKMVTQALKDVVRQNQYSYQTVFKEFVDDNNPSCPQCFWETFYRLFPASPYHFVVFCHNCRRFDLYETEAAMHADGPIW